MGSKEDLIFYAIASTIISIVAAALGASLAVIIFTSLIIPPVLLIFIRIIR